MSPGIGERVAVSVDEYTSSLGDILVERVAALCHESWMHWSATISIKEHISVDRLHRWQKLWVPYEQLPEAEKAKDREWARKIIRLGELLGVLDDLLAITREEKT